MSAPRLKVKLGGKTVEVPIYRDAKTTLKIAEALNERLKAIESASGRIDTQAFALEAAMAYAAEAQTLADEFAEDRAELIKELERLVKEVDKLTREFHHEK